MKKILFILMLFVAFSCSIHAENTMVSGIDTLYHDGKALVDTVYHDGKEAISVVYDDVKEGAIAIYPDVKSAVMSIGKAIGVAAEHVYSVLVKKYLVIGIKEAFICILSIISLIVGLVLWRKYTKNGQVITYSLLMPSIFIIVGLVTIFNVDYDAMLMGLINPEYGAINYILEYTKSLVK